MLSYGKLFRLVSAKRIRTVRARAVRTGTGVKRPTCASAMAGAPSGTTVGPARAGTPKPAPASRIHNSPEYKTASKKKSNPNSTNNVAWAMIGVKV